MSRRVNPPTSYSEVIFKIKKTLKASMMKKKYSSTNSDQSLKNLFFKYLVYIWVLVFIPNLITEFIFYFTQISIPWIYNILLNIAPLGVSLTLVFDTKRKKRLEELRNYKTKNKSLSLSIIDNNKILWLGKKSKFEIENLIFRYFFKFMIISGVIIVSAHILTVFYLRYDIKIHILFIFIPLAAISLSIILLGIFKTKMAKKIKYYLTKVKICWRFDNKIEQLSLNKIKKIEIKKSSNDLTTLNTGSIYFYDERQTPRIVFNHIEHVDEVGQIIQKLLPQLRK